MSPRLLFQIHPSSGVPIYRQLMDQVRTLIASGRLKSGEMLPSVRHIAEELQINHMTVSKAWSLLEREDVLERIRGQGMRVAAVENSKPGVRKRQQALRPVMEQLVAQAHQLNLTREQVLAALTPLLKDLKNE